MKKLTALLCAAALAATLAACGSQTSSAAPTATPSPTPDASAEQPATPEDGADTDGTGESGTPAVAEPDAELSALVDSIYETYTPELTLVTNAVDLNDSRWVGYYTGLTDTTGIEAAVASETAINAQAYSLVLVRVAEGTDAAEVADRMAAGINPGKWICAQADQVMVGAAGNIAMLVMADSGLSVSAQDVADAFVAAAGEGASAWVPETVGEAQGIPTGDDTAVQPVE